MIKARNLVEELLAVSQQIHPEYLQHGHTLWALGFLASITEQRAHNDSQVVDRIRARLRLLLEDNGKN